MITTESLFSTVNKVYPSVVQLRRKIHANPELSGEEFKTAALIHSRLDAVGLKPNFFINKTGVASTLKNRKGKTVVLRADIDALPIEEQNDIPFRSKKKNVMHACGHDMHTACLFGAAKVLIRFKEIWHGNIVFLFQPSEEVEPGGALRMIREGAFPERTSVVFGLHVSADYKTGQIALKSGKDYSNVLIFDIEVIGKGGHGAMPEKTIDPIVCAASMILNLQTLISRELPPSEPAVLTIASLHAGNRQNIIPDKAVFSGTIRTFSEKLQNHLMKRVHEVLKNIAKSFRIKVIVKWKKSYISGYNDPILTNRASKIFSDILGSDNVIFQSYPTMYAEDFAYYQKKAPGLLIHLGVRPPGKKNIPGIHNSRFLPDEKAIKTGIAVYSAFALDVLSG